MKKSINQFVKILTVLFVTSFITSCSNQQKGESQEQGDLMNDDQTEIMESNDHMHEMEDDGHMHEDMQSGEHMMDDTTAMEMNQKMEQ